MDYAEYQRRVLARNSHRWFAEKVDIDDLKDCLEEFISAGNRLDRLKKAVLYGRDYQAEPNEDVLEVSEAMPVLPEREQRLFHAAIGLATEGVELMEAMQAYFFQDKPMDEVNLQEEFGDAEWYRALGLAYLNQTHEQNIAQNDAKLEKRFGSTFTEEAANNRDLEGERKILEG